MSEVCVTINTLNGDFFEALKFRLTDDGPTVLDVKRELQSKLSVPRFCQQLLDGCSVCSDDIILHDDVIITFVKLQYTDDPAKIKRFYDAATTGNAELVEQQLRMPVAPSARPEPDKQASALEVAVRHGYEDIVQLLCDANACVDECVCGAETLLIHAVQLSHSRVAQILCKAGVDINASLPNGCTALSIAARRKAVVTVRVLCDARADVNRAAKDGTTPLQIALEAGQYNSSKELLCLGADRLTVSRVRHMFWRAAVSVRHQLVTLIILLSISMQATRQVALDTSSVGGVALAEATLGVLFAICGLMSLLSYMASIINEDGEQFPMPAYALGSTFLFLLGDMLGTICALQAWDHSMNMSLPNIGVIEKGEAGLALVMAGAVSFVLPLIVQALFAYRLGHGVRSWCRDDDNDRDLFFDILAMCCQAISVLGASHCKRTGISLSSFVTVAVMLALVGVLVIAVAGSLLVRGVPFVVNVARATAFPWIQQAADVDSAYLPLPKS